jgi:hypothetical protein
MSRADFSSIVAVAFLSLFVLLAQQGAIPARADLAVGAVVDPSFAGIDMHSQKITFGQWGIPPNPSCAVGPDHIIETTPLSVALFERDGDLLQHLLVSDFLKVTRENSEFRAIKEPSVTFDSRTGRWFAAAIAFAPTQQELINPMILAVSRTADPTEGWNTFLIPFGVPPVKGENTSVSDLKVGIDSTAIYFAARFTRSEVSHSKITATKLAPLLASSPSLGPLSQFDNLSGFVTVPRPATNADPSGPEWFADSIENQNSGVRLLKLTWNGSTASLSTPLNVATPAFGDPVDAPQKDTEVPIDTDKPHLLSAVIRNGHLWVCRTVGVNVSGGAAAPDRTGCEWIELNVSGATPSLAQSGRIFDTASTPRFYYFPTLSVNADSDVLVSYSGSKETEFAGAYFSGRLQTDAVGTMSPVQTLKSGEATYKPHTSGPITTLYGRYGAVVIDPGDGLSFWTCQSYAALKPTPDSWGTWIGQVKLTATPPLPGKAKIKPASVKFGKVKVGKTKSQSFTITNKGENPLIGSVDALEAPYSITDGGSDFNLEPREKRKVTVSFTPAKRGSVPSSIKVTTNDPDHSSVTIKLTGAGK